MSAEGEEGRAMGVVVSAWAAGALGGAQLHGLMSEEHAPELFALLTVVLIVALISAALMFRVLPSRSPGQRGYAIVNRADD